MLVLDTPDEAEVAVGDDGVAVAPAGTGLRLRVLHGRSLGAEHRLVDARAMRVGHSFENDIVLRGRDTHSMAFELQVEGDRVVVMTTAGELDVLGRRLGEGESMILPPYLPVRFGDFSFAVGEDDDNRWNEATALVVRGAEPVVEREALPQIDMLERASLRLAPFGGRLAAWLPPRRTLMVAAALLVAAVVGLFAGRAVIFPETGPAALKTMLAAQGFTAVAVRADPSTDALVITGVVKDDRDADRLRAIVEERAPGSLVEVDSTEAMAQAAGDLLAQQKITASAKAVRAGVIEVTTEYLPLDRQTELAGYLKRDLPGLDKVSFRAEAGRGDAQLRYFFNSPEHGAASFVSGDPGYIVTADGSRWFTGATLPTGHKIIGIDRNSVTLEHGGRSETLVM